MTKVTCDMAMSVDGFTVPVVLGTGERLFDGVGDLALEPLEVSGTGLVTHVSYRVG